MAAEPSSVTSLAKLRQPTENVPAVAMGFGTSTGFDLMQRVAKAFASSTLVPKQYQGNIPDCIIAIELASRIGASPLMVAQNLYVVHGRPAWSSQFLIAAVNQSGRFTALQYEWTGTRGKDDWGCRAHAKDKQTGERVQGPLVTIKTAKDEGWYEKSGSKWKTIPELMLMYRAAGWFARTNAPELTMGLQTAEEIHDVYDASKDDAGKFTVSDLKEGGTVVDTKTGEVSEPAVPDERQRTLDAIARTDDEEIAALALDGARGQEWYAEAEAVFRDKFGARD